MSQLYFLFQIDEIQSKNREVEKLEKLVNECIQINQKLREKDDKTVSSCTETIMSYIKDQAMQLYVLLLLI